MSTVMDSTAKGSRSTSFWSLLLVFSLIVFIANTG
jgi:hypothetical protein